MARLSFPASLDWSSTATHHSPLEDLQGIGVSILIVALALSIFQALGLITAGIAGLALIAHYATGLSVGTLFFVLNLPFYILAIRRLGWPFTLKTLVAVVCLSALLEVQDRMLNFGAIQPVYGVIIGGLLLGFGLLGMFRHRASLGGVGILAIYLQDRFGWRAGLVQLVVDLFILSLGFFVVPAPALALSILGVVVLNLFLAINHRPRPLCRAMRSQPFGPGRAQDQALQHKRVSDMYAPVNKGTPPCRRTATVRTQRNFPEYC